MASVVTMNSAAMRLATRFPIIAFWCEDEKRRHLKVFKPLVEVVEDDLPPWWMKNALIYDDEIRCSCC